MHFWQKQDGQQRKASWTANESMQQPKQSGLSQQSCGGKLDASGDISGSTDSSPAALLQTPAGQSVAGLPADAEVVEASIAERRDSRPPASKSSRQPELSVLLMARSLLIFEDSAYEDCLNSIHEVRRCTP